jgi:hypothetical protein
MDRLDSDLLFGRRSDFRDARPNGRIEAPFTVKNGDSGGVGAPSHGVTSRSSAMGGVGGVGGGNDLTAPSDLASDDPESDDELLPDSLSISKRRNDSSNARLAVFGHVQGALGLDHCLGRFTTTVGVDRLLLG